MLLKATLITWLVILHRSQCQGIFKVFEEPERIPRELTNNLIVFNDTILEDQDEDGLIGLYHQIGFSIQIVNTLDGNDLMPKSLIFMNANHPEISNFWDKMDQNSMSQNIWWIINDNPEDLDFENNSFRFGLHSLMFGIDLSSMGIVQYLGDGTKSPLKRNLYETLDSVNWSKVVKETRKRRDFNGLEFKVNFGDFPPFCRCTAEANPEALDGALVDTIKEVALTLNLTLKLQLPLPENIGVWAKKLPNGTYLGKIKEVHDGYADTSVGGFHFDIERLSYVDFSVATFKSFITMIIRRPNQLDMNLRYFLLEFSPESWILVLTSYVLIVFFTFLLMILTQKLMTKDQKEVTESFSTSLDVCLNAFITKRADTRFVNPSIKIAWFCIMLLGFVVMTYYRAQMNAALNVRRENYPVENWEDVLKSHYDVLVWRGTAVQDVFQFAPESSIFKRIFEQKISQIEEHVGSLGYSGSVKYILNDLAIVYIEYEPFKLMARQKYPCQLSFLDNFRRSGYLTMPFTKSSPFLAPVNDVLRHMMQSGTMKRIWIQYERLLTEDDCKEPRQVLGYPQLIFLVIILLCGALASFLIVTFEVMIKKCKQ